MVRHPRQETQLGGRSIELHVGPFENIFGLYRGCIGIVDKEMETTML